MTLKSVINIIKSPRRMKRRLLRHLYYRFPHNGVRVMEEDWDYLIVLDACRYDYFRKFNTIKGKLEKKISLASSTGPWLWKNFKDYYEDLIYISSNPHLLNKEDFSPLRNSIENKEIRKLLGVMPWEKFKGEEHFFKVEDTWNWGWDEKVGTVPPSNVTKGALKNLKKHPEKRMIIHYIQPHAPYIGKTKFLADKRNIQRESTGFKGWKILEGVRNGDIPPEKFRKAYRDNLIEVLDGVRELLKYLEGKIVITADHGEMLGELGLFGHFPNTHTKKLVEIPWFLIEKESKYIPLKDIEVSKKTKEKDKIQEDKIKKRLEALGYK